MDEILNTEQCVDCVNRFQFPNLSPCWKCLDVGVMRVTGDYYKKERVTHLERLRRMTRDEMADWMMNVRCCPMGEYASCPELYADAMHCRECVIEWLGEEGCD